jgi:RHS repeat-associated protein
MTADASALTADYSQISVHSTTLGSSDADTVQAIAVAGVSGTFTLAFNGDTTAPITYGSPPAAIAAALNALPSILDQQPNGDYGLVSVTGNGASGNPYLVTFAGLWSGSASVPLLSADGSDLFEMVDSITTAYNADGEITSTGDNFSHYAYTYTGQGDVASVDNAGTPGVPDVLLNSGYDTSGNRSSLSATIGGVKDFLTNYSYDTLSRLDEIDQQGQSGGNAVAMKSLYFGLDAIGDVTQIDRANSVFAGPQQNGPAYSLLSYAATTGLLTGINHEYMGASIDNLSYSYDSLARVSTFGSIDGTATYGYDATSQVISAAYTTASCGHQPANESFTRDANGNNSAAGNVVSPDNQVTNDGTFINQFDPAGNRTVRTRISTAYAADYKTTYGWDYRNRLTDVENFDNNGVLTQHVHYVYDVFDHLIERDLDPNGGGTYTRIVHNIWDITAPPSAGGAGLPPSAPGNIVLQTGGQQQLVARYLNGPNTSAYDQFFSILAGEDVTSPNSQGTVNYYLLNLEDTLTDLVDANGGLVDHIDYRVFGQVANESNPSVAHLGGFGGGLYDPATQLVYNIERWYDPAAAVWISADPTGFRAGDANLTRYVGNEATIKLDRSGLEGFIVNDAGPDSDFVNVAHSAASNVCSGTAIDAEDTGDAARRIMAALQKLDPKDRKIDYIEFWGHGSPGSMNVGNSRINSKLLDENTPDDDLSDQEFDDMIQLNLLRQYLAPNAYIYFRGCHTFRGTDGKLFAKTAARFFDRKVVGHTGAIAGPIQTGMQSLEPDEEPDWDDEEGLADKYLDKKDKGKTNYLTDKMIEKKENKQCD